MKNKNGAMEMSVGTIVTIVLLMSVLVLGLFLIRGIFSSAQGAVELTDQQLQSEIQKLFSEEAETVLYPTSGIIKIKAGETDQVGIGIKNFANSIDESTTFSYQVVPKEDSSCGIAKDKLLSWISQGASEENIPIGIGKFETARISFKIPEGTPACTATYRVNIYKGGKDYNSEILTVEVKP